jgi:hypothetical protein
MVGFAQMAGKKALIYAGGNSNHYDYVLLK